VNRGREENTSLPIACTLTPDELTSMCEGSDQDSWPGPAPRSPSPVVDLSVVIDAWSRRVQRAAQHAALHVIIPRWDNLPLRRLPEAPQIPGNPLISWTCDGFESLLLHFVSAAESPPSEGTQKRLNHMVQSSCLNDTAWVPGIRHAGGVGGHAPLPSAQDRQDQSVYAVSLIRAQATERAGPRQARPGERIAASQVQATNPLRLR
jgi:hypothetical protein